MIALGFLISGINGLANYEFGSKSSSEAVLYGLIEGIVYEALTKLNEIEGPRLLNVFKNSTIATIIAHNASTTRPMPFFAENLFSPILMISFLRYIHDQLMPSIHAGRNPVYSRTISVH